MNKFMKVKFNTTIGSRLIAAAGLGKIKEVTYLAPKSNSQDCNDALLAAIDEGQIECAKILVPVHSKMYKNEKLAWYRAVQNGYTELVKRFAAILDPQMDGSKALRVAAYNGYTDIVELLIPLSNPNAEDSLALRWAASREHIEIIEMLIPVSDYKNVLQSMKNDSLDASLLQQCIEKHEALQQKERLNNTLAHIDESKSSNAKRKM